MKYILLLIALAACASNAGQPQEEECTRKPCTRHESINSVRGK